MTLDEIATEARRTKAALSEHRDRMEATRLESRAHRESVGLKLAALRASAVPEREPRPRSFTEWRARKQAKEKGVNLIAWSIDAKGNQKPIGDPLPLYTPYVAQERAAGNLPYQSTTSTMRAQGIPINAATWSKSNKEFGGEAA